MCVIIPTGSSSSLHLVHIVKDFPARVVPDRHPFAIKSCARYLGVFLGPDAGERSWDVPWATAAIRVEEIVLSRLAPSIGTFCCNSRVVALFEYVAQFIPPPRSSCHKEMIYSNKTVFSMGLLLVLELPPPCIRSA